MPAVTSVVTTHDMTSPEASHPPRLALRGIEKRYPGVRALAGIDLDVAAGQVHAVLGENGAGKSTLMHVVYGLVAPDAGTMSWEGRPVRLRSPREAIALGIGLVAQHFHLVERHTVVENLALGFPGAPAWRPTRAVLPQLRAAADRYGLALDPHALVRDLSPGERQRVELVKALVQGARLLVLDEPTSVLTPVEVDALFTVLRRFVAEGSSVVFVSHKLAEVEVLADAVTVLRRGAVVGRRSAMDGLDRRDLARLMVGRDLAPAVAAARRASAVPSLPGPVRLRLDGVQVAAPARGREAGRGRARRGAAAAALTLDIPSLEVRGGEIVGIAGVAGNGQTELVEVVAGLRAASAGRVEIDGREAGVGRGARDRVDAGVALVPEDRTKVGVVGDLSVERNLALRHAHRRPFARGMWVDWGAVGRASAAAVAGYDIATPSTRTAARFLSGGNVQKLILARELEREPGVVVAVHPTYGLDVAATAQTHARLLAAAARGAAVLLVSEDLDEVLALSDRVAVLAGGRLAALLAAADADAETLGLAMAGVAA
jgi:general nucleoside transport system ATP-binding protein